jgi:hypothetical protein
MKKDISDGISAKEERPIGNGVEKYILRKFD